MKSPSDKTIPEFKHNSLIEAIRKLLDAHVDIKSLDMVIPFSIPKPIKFSVPRHKAIPDYPTTPTLFNSWGHKPIPRSTIEFIYGKYWVVATPPYKGQNVYYFKNPLPDTLAMTIIKGISLKPVRIINGTLKRDVVIELETCKAHIYKVSRGIKIEFVKYV